VYWPETNRIAAVEPVKKEQPVTSATVYRSIGMDRTLLVRQCRNGIDYEACNWGLPHDAKGDYCVACALNEVIPNLADADAKVAWLRLEIAKRRLIYALLDLGLPVEPKQGPEGPGLSFSFLQATQQQVFTGHSNGNITINIAEADAPFRERMRVSMSETYRTLLGHFRHEIGHYYWERLVKDGPELKQCRDVFGDEGVDYSESQQRHYAEGPPADWSVKYVSAYASMHPWEDFAETWAHYLHIVDTLDTARSYGLHVRAEPVGGAERVPRLEATDVNFDNFNDLIRSWIPLTVALNSLNRSMGLADLYPFVLSNGAIAKLRYIHDLIERSGSRRQP
jgi:hypothetical protein